MIFLLNKIQYNILMIKKVYSLDLRIRKKNKKLSQIIG